MDGNIVATTIAILQMLDDSDDESSSSSSSSSDVDSDVQTYLNVVETVSKQRKQQPIEKGTVTDFCDDILTSYSENDFKTSFRISRAVMQSLVKRFTDSDLYQSLILPGSRACISPAKHILAFLWFSGNRSATFRTTALKFRLSLSSMHDVFSRMTSFLCSLAPEEIHWPTYQQRAETMDHYMTTHGFPNIIGLIGVSHIKLDKPKPNENVDYMNRHGYHSMILQGICNEECKFINIFVECPGYARDVEVFEMSPIYESLEQSCQGGYLLGSSAYPTSNILMTPFRDTEFLTQDQKLFNEIHSSCHISTEHTFAMLKQRFQQLFHLKIKSYERICSFITACCVLHNLADTEDLETFVVEENPIDEQPLLDEIADDNHGNQLRKEIKHQLSLKHILECDA